MNQYTNCDGRVDRYRDVTDELVGFLSGTSWSRDEIDAVLQEWKDKDYFEFGDVPNATAMLPLLEERGVLAIARRSADAHKAASYLANDLFTIVEPDLFTIVEPERTDWEVAPSDDDDHGTPLDRVLDKLREAFGRVEYEDDDEDEDDDIILHVPFDDVRLAVEVVEGLPPGLHENVEVVLRGRNDDNAGDHIVISHSGTMITFVRKVG